MKKTANKLNSIRNTKVIMKMFIKATNLKHKSSKKHAKILGIKKTELS